LFNENTMYPRAASPRRNNNESSLLTTIRAQNAYEKNPHGEYVKAVKKLGVTLDRKLWKNRAIL